MFLDYVNVAMSRAKFESLEDGTWFGSIPGFRGVWSNAKTRRAARSTGGVDRGDSATRKCRITVKTPVLFYS